MPTFARIFRSALFFFVGVLLGGYATYSFASDSIVTQYMGAWQSTPGSWTLDLNTAGAQGVSIRNAGCTDALCGVGWHPCSFTRADTSTAYGTCGSSAEVGVAVIFTRSRCLPGDYAPTNGQCVPSQTCSASGTVFSSGIYDTGTKIPDSTYADIAGWVYPGFCSSGCSLRYQSSSAGSTYYQWLVNGTYHYGTNGQMVYTGDSCTAGTAPPSATSSKPTDTCGSGQTMGTVNGKTICVDNSTSKQVNPNDPNANTKTVATTNTFSTDANNNTTQTSVTVNPDNSKTTTTTVTNSAGKVVSVTSSTTPGFGPVSGGSSGTGSAPTNPNGAPQVDICSQNPNSPACKPTDPGAPATVSNLYTKDTTGRTFGSVLNDFQQTVSRAPFYQAATGFFNWQIPGGGCGGLDGSYSYSVGGYSGTIDLNMSSILCGGTADTIYRVLGIGLMLASTWVAFRIAIL